MSKPRIQIYLDVDTLIHAETIPDIFNAKLIGKDIFENHYLEAQTDSLSGKPYFRAELRMNKEIERDELWDYMKNKIQIDPIVKNWILGARISRHLCTHDDPSVKNCKKMQYEEFVK